MDELRENVAAERQRVETTLAELSHALARETRSTVELAGIATFLLNVYNGIENILKQVLRTEGVRIRASETWHTEVLNEASVRGIISPDLRRDLRPFLGFRHFFVHGYGYMLEEAPLMDLANRASTVWSRFIAEVERFVAERSSAEHD